MERFGLSPILVGIITIFITLSLYFVVKKMNKVKRIEGEKE